MLQPLVENAFKHGLFHKEGNGHLVLQFSKEKKYLQFTIEDDGIGRKRSQIINNKNLHYKPHDSSGLKTIKDRLELIRQGVIKTELPVLQIEDLYREEEAVGTKITASIFCQNFN